jgi:HK97 family phage major capsid protein
MRSISDLNSAMQAIVDLADAETRSLSDEEVVNYEALETELHSAQKSEDIVKRQAAYRSPIVGFPSVIKPTPKGDEALDFAFTQYLRTGQVNSDMSQLFAQTIGSDAGGGYTVPSSFRNKLVERMVAFGGFANLVETIDTGDGRPIEWPTVDDTPTAGAATDAAIKADIVAEGAASIVGADITFGTASLGAYRYAATGTGNVPIKVSVELLQDSAFDVAAFVARALGTRIARAQARDIVRGTGVGMPLGILSGTDGDVAESTLVYAKLNELVHKLDLAYRPGASWLFNDTVAAELETLVDGAQRPLLMPSTSALTGSVAPNSLLGYPVHIDQYCFDDATNVQYVGFGDWRESYILRRVRDVQVLVNPYAATGYVVYDAWARMDGTIQNYNSYVTIEGE